MLINTLKLWAHSFESIHFHKKDVTSELFNKRFVH